MSQQTEPYILRPDYYGPFKIRSIDGDQPLKMHTSFGHEDMSTFKMVLELDQLKAGLTARDVMNPELVQADPPEIVIYVALLKSGQGFEGGVKERNKQIIAMSRGRDFIRYSEFIAICKQGNVDIKQLGKARPVEGGKLEVVWMRCAALEGQGQYAARNAYRAWSATPDRFAQEDKAKLDALTAGLAGMPAAVTLADADRLAEDAPVKMSLLPEPVKSVAQSVAVAVPTSQAKEADSQLPLAPKGKAK